MQITDFRPSDHQTVLQFLSRQARVHYHLDWQTVPTWLRDPQNIILLFWRDDLLRGAMAFTPSHMGISWVRLLSISLHEDRPSVFAALWQVALARLRSAGVQQIALMTNHAWVLALVQQFGFVPVDMVINYVRSSRSVPTLYRTSPVRVRDARSSDLATILSIDHVAFAGLWQMREHDLAAAARRAVFYKVAFYGGQAVGYQLSMHYGAVLHLSRLATLPQFQGRGIGRTLVYDLLVQAAIRGIETVTVNTQLSNVQSQRLYESMGFEREYQDVNVLSRAL